MEQKQFSMDSAQIAKIVGTVGSPLIVVAELLKNAVDASATQIDVFYDKVSRSISVENDKNGFSPEEIEALARPGISTKKNGGYLKNDRGMYLTGSKGLGILSVFLLCTKAEILTASNTDKKVYRIYLDKMGGTVIAETTELIFEKSFTRVTLIDVNIEIIDFLSSESEVRKLRHICTSLYKSILIPFPKMHLHISDHEVSEINFTYTFPPMLYDVSFRYFRDSKEIKFQCKAQDKPINSNEITISSFDLESLNKTMLDFYGIKETIPTRTNELAFTNYNTVPSFEGRIVVYERNLAGSQLKTYGAGVNIYVNDFALYNYLAEENDWLGLADYSQRKKTTRLKPHNVFGYVNFPAFDENSETLQISNERADFIQELTYTKLMYLLKGVVMFAILNIDVADKNPKYKADIESEENPEENPDKSDDDSYQQLPVPSASDKGGIAATGGCDTSNNETDATKVLSDILDGGYSPVTAYKPKQNIKKCLQFTKEEGKIVDSLKDTDDLSNKIYNLIYELYKMDLQEHRYSTTCLFRTLIESATKYIARRQPKIIYNTDSLESSVVSVLNYFGNNIGSSDFLSNKAIKTWRTTVCNQKIIDILNEYIHNETPVDTFKLQETWNTMKGYIIACIMVA